MRRKKNPMFMGKCISLTYKGINVVIKRRGKTFKVSTDNPNPIFVNRIIKAYLMGMSYDDYKELCIKRAIKKASKPAGV